MSESAQTNIDPEVEDYGAESIKVLKGLDAVRKRPGMYIGDTDDGSGLHQMIYEVVDNAVDEALAGFCDEVEIILNPDGTVTVRDNGRGIPTGIHEEEGISAAEVIMTHLHAGGKFDQNSYKVSGGLHGVGVSVVNALSKTLELRIFRGGKRALDEVCRRQPGKPVGSGWRCWRAHGNRSPVFGVGQNLHQRRIRPCDPGTPAAGIGVFEFRPERHFGRCPGRGPGARALPLPRRNRRFVVYLDRKKTAIHAPPITIMGKKDLAEVELALQWNDSYHENVLCFTNNIPNPMAAPIWRGCGRR